MFKTENYNVIDDLLDRYYHNYDATCDQLSADPPDKEFLSGLEASLDTPDPIPFFPEEKKAIKNKAKVKKKYDKMKKSRPPPTTKESTPFPISIDPFLSLASYSPSTDKEYELVQTLLGRYHPDFNERFKVAAELNYLSPHVADCLKLSYESGVIRRKVACGKLIPEIFQNLIDKAQKI